MVRTVARPRLLPAVCLALLLSSAAQAKDGWFGAEKPGEGALFYGAVPPAGEPPNPETIQLSFSCAETGRAIALFIAESSNNLGASGPVRVVLTAGGKRAVAVGRTLPNQLAGVPSIQVTFPVDAPVFAGMTETASLRIQADNWTHTTPLSGIGGRVKTLLATCSQ